MRAEWAPLLLRPILGSPERIVIAVAVVTDDSFYVERANSLSRLHCLFGELSPSVVLAAETAIDALSDDLALRGRQALHSFMPIFEGCELGEIGEGEGKSLPQLAASWLAGLSSVHSAPDVFGIEVADVETDDIVSLGPARDRLPSLVLDYVEGHRPGLSHFFSEDIRLGARRRRRGRVHDVIIDFAGSRLVANFGTLSIVNHASSIDRIKRRLWDLELRRDRDSRAFLNRSHEMLIQHPAENDPQISERQFVRIHEALEALREQAQTEGLSLQSMISVEQIGDHVLAAEAAPQLSP